MHDVFKIGVFDDLSKARDAVNDAVAAGISRDDITLIVSEDANTDNRAIAGSSEIVHPTSDTERGHFGGAFGAALGALSGSLTLFFLSHGDPSGPHTPEILISVLTAAGVGVLAGAGVARGLPQLIRKVLRRAPEKLLGGIGHTYDTRRSMVAGAIGGLFGATAGTLASVLIGIQSIWFFLSTGLACAAVSLIVGGLIGAMSGRGLAPRAAGAWEDLVDAGHKILVSVDCSHKPNCLPLIEDLLRRDGARMIRTA